MILRIILWLASLVCVGICEAFSLQIVMLFSPTLIEIKQYFAHEDLEFGMTDTPRVTEIVSSSVPKEIYIQFATTVICLLQGSYLVLIYCIPMTLYNLKMLPFSTLFRKCFRRSPIIKK